MPPNLPDRLFFLDYNCVIVLIEICIQFKLIRNVKIMRGEREQIWQNNIQQFISKLDCFISSRVSYLDIPKILLMTDCVILITLH